MKTWVLDAQDKTAILSTAKMEGKSSRNGPTGSLRQIRAVRLGLDEQMKAFLKNHKNAIPLRRVALSGSDAARLSTKYSGRAGENRSAD